MNVILVLLVSFLVAVSQQQTVQEALVEWRKLIAPHMSRCMCQSNTSPDVIESLFQLAEMPTDPCFKCNLRCWAQGVGVLSTSGNVNTTMFGSIFGITDEIVHKCSTNQHVDLCEKAFEIFTCTFTRIAANPTNNVAAITPAPIVPHMKLWSYGPKIVYGRP